MAMSAKVGLVNIVEALRIGPKPRSGDMTGTPGGQRQTGGFIRKLAGEGPGGPAYRDKHFGASLFPVCVPLLPDDVSESDSRQDATERLRGVLGSSQTPTSQTQQWRGPCGAARAVSEHRHAASAMSVYPEHNAKRWYHGWYLINRINNKHVQST